MPIFIPSSNNNRMEMDMKRVFYLILFASAIYIFLDNIGFDERIKFYSYKLFPSNYISTQAQITDCYRQDYDSHGRFAFDAHYEVTEIQYIINGEVQKCQLIFRQGDAIGNSLGIAYKKDNYKNVIRSDAMPYSLNEILGVMAAVIYLGYFIFSIFDIDLYTPKREHESSEKEDNLLMLLKGTANTNNEQAIENMNVFLKKNKVKKLGEELRWIFEHLDLQQFLQWGFLFDVKNDIFDFIYRTEQEWENNHFKGYVVLQEIKHQVYLYNIKEENIYYWDKYKNRYVFERGSLYDYIIFFANNSLD